MVRPGADWSGFAGIAPAGPGSLSLGQILRFETKYAMLRDEVETGRLGRIVSMYARRNRPKRLLERLFAEKLFASAHYASLAGIMTPGRCPEAERLASQVINLFNDHHYTAAMAHRTCDILQETLS